MREAGIAESTVIGSITQSDLDYAYEKIDDIPNWREHFKLSSADPLTADLEQLEMIRNDLADRAKLLNTQLIDLMPERDCFSSQDFESFLTMGLPPEAEYCLSLDTASNPESGSEWGMNAEEMLKEMHQILVEDIPFDMNINNCSVTASRILEAGAKGEHLKSKFRNRVLGDIATPQLVANNTEDFLSEYQKSPKDNIFKKIARWNPIERMLGKQVHTMLSDDHSFAERNMAWVKAGAIIALTSPLLIVRGLFSPANTFKQSAKLIQFARSKDHVGFKAAAFTIGGLGMIAFSVPAIAETIIKAPFRLVGHITSAVKQRRIRRMTEHVDIPKEELEARSEKEALYKEKLAETEERIVLIKNRDPLKALNKAKQVNESRKMPMFEAKTRLRIEQYIEKTKDKSTKEELTKEYTGIIQAAAAQTKQSLNTQYNASKSNKAVSSQNEDPPAPTKASKKQPFTK